jgi:hypothetical protein
MNERNFACVILDMDRELKQGCGCGWPKTCCRKMYPEWHPDEPPEPGATFDGETWRT